MTCVLGSEDVLLRSMVAEAYGSCCDGSSRRGTLIAKVRKTLRY